MVTVGVCKYMPEDYTETLQLLAVIGAGIACRYVLERIRV